MLSHESVKLSANQHRIHRRKVAISHCESLHCDGKFPRPNITEFEWRTNTDNEVMLFSIYNQALRFYAFRAMHRSGFSTQLIDAINLFWDVITKNNAKCHQEYVRMRNLMGYEYDEGWIERERADDIERFVHGNMDTAYSQISPQLLKQIQHIEKARKARA